MSSMATETKPPHRKLIKLCCPRPTHDYIPHDHSEMEEKKEVQRITAKEKSREVAEGSRTVSKVCPLKNKKGYYAVTVWVKPENPSNSSARLDSITSRKESEECELKNKREIVPDSRTKGYEECELQNMREIVPESRTSRKGYEECELENKREIVPDSRTSRKGYEECKLENKREIVPDSRTSRKGYEECKLENKRKSVGVECNEREKKRNMNHTMMMDSSRKMQCWALLKRVMVGRDAWALKQPLLHHNSVSVRKPKRNGLEDIESKLRKLGYSCVDEFAHDVRLVFSYSLGYPPRSEIHRTAKRISEGFEVSWKKLKWEWMSE